MCSQYAVVLIKCQISCLYRYVWKQPHESVKAFFEPAIFLLRYLGFAQFHGVMETQLLMCSIHPLPTQVRRSDRSSRTDRGRKQKAKSADFCVVVFFFFCSITIIMSRQWESQDGHNVRPRWSVSELFRRLWIPTVSHTSRPSAECVDVLLVPFTLDLLLDLPQRKQRQ